MFEQVFKNIDNTLRTDDGCSTELDYAEQSSWILFLKWLDDYENQEMYEYLGQVSELWTLILEEIRPTMQRFDEVRVFESGRNNGWDVPIGKVCFIFSDYGMFKTTLTAEGKAFEKHMGKVEKVEWTDISC